MYNKQNTSESTRPNSKSIINLVQLDDWLSQIKEINVRSIKKQENKHRLLYLATDVLELWPATEGSLIPSKRFLYEKGSALSDAYTFFYNTFVYNKVLLLSRDHSPIDALVILDIRNI